MNHGFIKVAAAVPRLKVADCSYNIQNIISLVKKAESLDVQFVVFPELSITSYTCGDLFQQKILLDSAAEQLGIILKETEHTGIVCIVGMPIYSDNQLFNCGVVIQGGRILGVVPKTFIPCYKEFYEGRWFAPGTKNLRDTILLCGQTVPFGIDLLFECDKNSSVCFGIELCEDLWVPVPPSSNQAMSGAVLLFNLSASDEIIGKSEYRKQLIKQQSGRCIAGYIYASGGIDESTTDVVFGGHAIIAENGILLEESKRFLRDEQIIISEIDIERLINERLQNTVFAEAVKGNSYRRICFRLDDTKVFALNRSVNPHPFVPPDISSRDERCSEIFSIQTSGLAKRLQHTGMKNAVIGISGGLDSTLALLVTVETFDVLNISRKNIVAVTMPGFGTTGVTYNNALKLMEAMEVTIKEVDIKAACLQHFSDIAHDSEVYDNTYENVQARERTQILMDMANKLKGLVIGTGDLSELALGWCTYNGDHMSMYAVNCGIPKTLVKFLVRWVADNIVNPETRDVLLKVITTPISPELLPVGTGGEINQRTEDIIGPYELHDFFLYHMIRYGAPPSKIIFLAENAFAGKYKPQEIKDWIKLFYKRFFSQQFKRSCLPDGPKVGTISLSPRGDWRMPSDAESSVWIGELG